MQKLIHRRPPNAVALATLLIGALACSTLSGCNSLYSEGATAGAGIAGAAIAGSVTRNAAVATGIGLGAVAAARAGVQYSQRVMHTYTQDRIAGAAGPLPGSVERFTGRKSSRHSPRGVSIPAEEESRFHSWQDRNPWA